MGDLLNVDVAIERILEQMGVLSSEVVRLEDSLGRVLAEDIVSDIDLPPFDNSAMDGFAIQAIDSEDASTENPSILKVTMDIPAGMSPEERLSSGEAARIMTGAPIPEGADAVIPVEDTDADFSDLDAATLPETVALHKVMPVGAAIRKMGENIQRGQTILKKNRILSPADIGILASLGRGQFEVIRQPRVAIVGSGDELVGVDEPLEAGQIRDSNSYALAALIEQDGGIALKQENARDNPESIRKMFQDTLALQPDLIVSSAGVSVGAADYIRAILEELGEIGFWRINLRPGKPLAFGKIDGIPFFGLPGNPVSAMVTYNVLVRPALLKLAGKVGNIAKIRAKVGQEMRSDGRRTYARVRLQREGDDWVAYETGTQSSGAHLSMVLADGLLIIPENIGIVAVGTELEVQLLRDILWE